MPILEAERIGPKDAPIVVFLHGGGMNGRSLRPIAARLTEYRCILPDLPGHGANHNVSFESFAASANTVANALRTRNVGAVHLFGLSMGGFIALHLMAAHPDLVTSATISGVHPGTMRARPLLRLAIWATYPLMRSEAVRTLSARAIGITDTTLMSDTAGQPLAAPHTIRDIGLAAVDFATSELPARITTRTLLLAGSREIAAVVGGLNGFEDIFDNHRAARVPGGDHGWCLDRPGLAAATIDAWVKRERLPGELAPTGPEFISERQ